MTGFGKAELFITNVVLTERNRKTDQYFKQMQQKMLTFLDHNVRSV